MDNKQTTPAQLEAEMQTLPQPLTTGEGLDYGQRLTQLAQAAETILAALNMTALWTAVSNAMQTIFQADALAIYLYDQEGNNLINVYNLDLSDTFLNWLTGQPTLWPTGQITLYANLDDENGLTPWQAKFQADGIHALAIFPLILDGQEQGNISLYWQTAVAFTAQDLSAGQMLAHITAVAMQNIRLFAAQNHALQREQKLNEFSRVLNSIQDLPSILAYVIRMATELANANNGGLGLIVDDQVMVFYPYNISPKFNLQPLPRGQGLSWEIVETGAPLLLDDYSSHPQAQPEVAALGVTAFLGVPITASGDVCLGTIGLFRHTANEVFQQRDLDLVESLARQAGTAIQNARLYAEFERRATVLASALARQEDLDRLKNHFVQNVSHELRTPLGIIYGHAELLESGMLGDLQPDQQESIQIIARRARMLTDLVEDLTALLAAETQEFRRQEIDPIQLIHSLVADYQLEAEEKGLALKVILPETVSLVIGDPTHLRRVFDNLVSNAFKFTDAGGKITIRLWYEENDVAIEVADTGIGIPADQLNRIFERFYQIDGSSTRRFGGTGLGLALVKEIITAHRGRVAVYSEAGKGATFRVTLPVAIG
jgi:signal transduction histidine kinase